MPNLIRKDDLDGIHLIRNYTLKTFEGLRDTDLAETGRQKDGQTNQTEMVTKKEFEEAIALSEHRYREGLIKGQQEGKAELKTLLNMAKKMLEQVQKMKDTLIRESEEDLVRLSLTIAEKIIRLEVKQNPEIIKNLARQAIDHLIDKDGIILRLNPKDLARLKEIGSDLTDVLGSSGKLEIIADNFISEGDCIVEAKAGSVDTGIKTQLKEIEKYMLKRQYE